MSANKAWLRALERTREVRRASTRTLPAAIEAVAEDHGEAPALLGETETFSYGELADRLRRYARWALRRDLVSGDVVALLAPNRPEYLACWLGLTRVGVVVALINTNLRGAALVHSLQASGAGDVIVDPEFLDILSPDWAGQVHRLGDDMLAGCSEAPLPPNAIVLSDPALLIYTSGTTGWPKAARVSHHRLMMWSGWFAGMMDASPADRLYDCLPLYHSVGGVVGPGAMLVSGGSVVLRRRFSARTFWTDVAEQRCTVFQYIGELCRYLLAAPPGEADRAHGLRLAVGNGLRGEVWRPFQDRFAIPQVLEFYASTEGAFSLYNAEGEPGAIGRTPPYLAHRFPAAIVCFNAETEQPLRDADGRCIACGPDEVGEAIGRIADAGADSANRFEGYTDAQASARKVLHDVFEPGDAWLRTGDLMRRDGRGFWWFVDRVGDTFRWKGENVSTTEVAAALSTAPGVQEACVYGVAVPGADGKVGMAALVAGPNLDLAVLHSHLQSRLPSYARPLFLRLCRELPTTETFKLKKQALIDEGFDPGAGDPVFMDRGHSYTPLDQALYDGIVTGLVRV